MSRQLFSIVDELSNDLSLDFLENLFDSVDGDSSDQAYLSSLLEGVFLSPSNEVDQQSDIAGVKNIKSAVSLLDSTIDFANRFADRQFTFADRKSIAEALATISYSNRVDISGKSLSPSNEIEGIGNRKVDSFMPSLSEGGRLGDIIKFQKTFSENQFVKKVGLSLAMLNPDFSMEGWGNDEIAFAKISFQSQAANLQLANGGVVIDAVANGDAQELLADLQSLGLEGSAFGNMVSGWLPFSAIGSLADLSSLKSAQPSYAITRVGSVTSQADPALEADIARDLFGVDGSGINVGILSDSFEASFGAVGSYDDDILSGDLPDDVEILADIFFGIDEGRAMAQLIYDLAPGSDLTFRTAFRGAADFANGILELVDAGADVIVDDIGYLNEPFFQDGVIAQAADQAFAAGVPYFSAAGNSGDDSYESSFRFGQEIDNYRFHDFDPGNGVDIFQEFTLAPGQGVSLSFQWDEPFSSTGGIGASSDLDLFILDDEDFSLANVVAAGTDNNIASGNAVELVNFTNTTGSIQSFYIALGRDTNQGGADPGRVKYIDFNGQALNIEYDTNSSTSFGHPNAAGSASVGAAFFAETPEFGTNPPALESFSSLGGTEILFDADGNRLATPDVRQSVDFVAVDGTNTTFFGGDTGEDPDSFPNFFGTSAAAPHAAAVAALMLEAANEAGLDPTPQEIYDALAASAIDMDNPFTNGFDVGYDFATGFGLIQADEAIAILLDSVQPPDGEIINGTAGRDNLTGTSGDDVITGFARRDILFGDTGADQFVYVSQEDGVDRIEDFEVGVDKIVLTDLFQTLNYNGNDPFADGFLGARARRGSDSVLLLDPNGGGNNLTTFIQFNNVTVAELTNLDNFII